MGASNNYSCIKLLLCAYSVLGRRKWHPTPILLPGKSHGRRSLVGCSPWGRWESDTTEWLPFHFLFSCIGEGNGNPLQCSCLENPGTGEPGGLLSVGSHRVRHDWSDLAAAACCFQEGSLCKLEKYYINIKYQNVISGVKLTGYKFRHLLIRH